MSEGAVEGQSEQQPNEGGNSGYTPPATQQDLNRIINDRVARERQKFADYKDLQGKAAQFDQLEESKKTEVQKAQDRASAAEAEAATVPAKVAEALKTHLVSLHEINSDDAELFLTATEPGLLLKQVGRLVGRESDRRKQGNHVPREGTTSSNVDTDEREAVRNLFG